MNIKIIVAGASSYCCCSDSSWVQWYSQKNLTLFDLRHNATKWGICMTLQATFFPWTPFRLWSCADVDCVYTVLWCAGKFWPVTTMSRTESEVWLLNLEKYSIKSQCLDDKMKLTDLTALEWNESPRIASWKGAWKKKLSPIPCWHLVSWATGYSLLLNFATTRRMYFIFSIRFGNSQN